MDSILAQSQISLLNAIGENIFICDENHQIIMLNDYSSQLINRLMPYTGLASKDDYLGRNICEFSPEEDKALLKAFACRCLPL